MSYAIPFTRVVIEDENVNAGLYADMLGLSLQEGQSLDTLAALPLGPAECFPCAVEAVGGMVERLNAQLAGIGVMIVAERAGWRLPPDHRATLEKLLADWLLRVFAEDAPDVANGGRA